MYTAQKYQMTSAKLLVPILKRSNYIFFFQKTEITKQNDYLFIAIRPFEPKRNVNREPKENKKCRN